LVSDLRRWIEDDQVRLAVALDTAELGSVLVTHSGLTRQKWEVMGAPAAIADTCAALNAELARDPAAAFRPGEMLAAPIEGPVGVVWASPAELLSSWDQHELPFSQIYGHATPVRWNDQTWDPRLPKRFMQRGKADAESRSVEFEWPSGGRLICVDPDYGTKSAPARLVPYVVTGRIVGTS
jgi:hypothetical protein